MGKLRFACFSGKSLVSKGISFWTRSLGYSHIGFVTGVKTPGYQLIEAWGGVKISWCYSDYSQHSERTKVEEWELEVPELVSEMARKTFHAWAQGKMSYDWRGIFGFVLKSVRDRKAGRFCSEGCVEPLVVGLEWSKINPAHISPQRFVELVQAAGGKLVKSGEVRDGQLV